MEVSSSLASVHAYREGTNGPRSRHSQASGSHGPEPGGVCRLDRHASRLLLEHRAWQTQPEFKAHGESGRWAEASPVGIDARGWNLAKRSLAPRFGRALLTPHYPGLLRIRGCPVPSVPSVHVAPPSSKGHPFDAFVPEPLMLNLLESGDSTTVCRSVARGALRP